MYDQDDSELAGKTSVAERALSNHSNPTLMASMLDLRDVYRLGALSTSARKAYGRKARKTCLMCGEGVPEGRRLEYWRYVLNIEKAMAERSAKTAHRSEIRGLYTSILHGKGGAGGEEDGNANEDPVDGDCSAPRKSGKGALSSSGAEGEILRDVGRTFPSQRIFRDPNGMGQNMLANVLRACLASHPDVGYCQGMNFVAGALLLVCVQKEPDLMASAETPGKKR
ncbi:unnamed protein product, partial [Discosporangium mesarthrocarpum]